MFAKELDLSSPWTLCSLIPMTVNILYCADPLNIAEWDDDMTYLYVDYPYYKKFLIFASISAVCQSPTLHRKFNNFIVVPVPLQL